ncbi:hypothetical protein AB0C40_29770 [Streptomyces brevispora]|uniref:hypothetical protein n=1 Tax=Streptomyces brevispora TaxID=887462 RepID=UPI0033FE57BA
MCHRLHVPTHGEDFPALRNRAYPATGTSSEAESEPDGLPGGHTPSGVGHHATRYATTGHSSDLLNGGNTAHFPLDDQAAPAPRPRPTGDRLRHP